MIDFAYVLYKYLKAQKSGEGSNSTRVASGSGIMLW